MRLNVAVVKRLCTDYCILYKKRFELGYEAERESEFNRCKGMIGLTQALIGAQIQTNIGEGVVGIRMINPETGTVLGEDTRKVEYSLDAVLTEIFQGKYRKIADGLYSLSKKVKGSLEEGTLVCTPDYTVSLQTNKGTFDVTTCVGVKELFRVVGYEKTPLVTVRGVDSSNFKFEPIRIYVR